MNLIEMFCECFLGVASVVGSLFELCRGSVVVVEVVVVVVVVVSRTVSRPGRVGWRFGIGKNFLLYCQRSRNRETPREVFLVFLDRRSVNLTCAALTCH